MNKKLEKYIDSKIETYKKDADSWENKLKENLDLAKKEKYMGPEYSYYMGISIDCSIKKHILNEFVQILEKIKEEA